MVHEGEVRPSTLRETRFQQRVITSPRTLPAEHAVWTQLEGDDDLLASLDGKQRVHLVLRYLLDPQPHLCVNHELGIVRMRT